MHAYYVDTLLQVLEPSGVTASDLLEGTGLADHVRDENFALAAPQLDTICERALDLTGDEQLGLRFGGRISIASQGIFGYALMTSATIGDALTLLIRYNRVILPSINIGLARGDEALELYVEAPHLPARLRRYYTEVLYAAVVNSGRILLDGAAISVRWQFQHGVPEDLSRYRLFLGEDLAFGAQRSAMFISNEGLAAPISTSNPVARDIFQRECDRLISRDDRGGHVSAQVQQILLRAGSEFPTAAHVAQQLHMSESTLQRHLRKEGVRYQEMLDQVRYRLAREYLSGTTLPVAEIASLLGFSDAANFRRSFRRWSGTTPSAFRG